MSNVAEQIFKIFLRIFKFCHSSKLEKLQRSANNLTNLVNYNTLINYNFKYHTRSPSNEFPIPPFNTPINSFTNLNNLEMAEYNPNKIIEFPDEFLSLFSNHSLSTSELNFNYTTYRDGLESLEEYGDYPSIISSSSSIDSRIDEILSKNNTSYIS